MSFFARMNMAFTLLEYLELLLRIVAAAVCGGIVGIERSRRFKDAGVRTHCLVACSAALMMIISKYGFADLAMADGLFPGTRAADPARIAAQVVSGISFLGIGIIYRDRHLATKGLTTAAGIWAVAGIGMAMGAGLYVVGLFSTLFIVIVQLITHRFTIGNDRYTGAELNIVMEDSPEAVEHLHDTLAKYCVVVTKTDISRENGRLSYDLSIKLPTADLHRELTAFLGGNPVVHSVRIDAEEDPR